MHFKINMGAFVSTIFAQWVKARTSNTITQNYNSDNPFSIGVKRADYVEYDLFASIQDYKTGAYNATSDNVIIKNGIRINAEINNYNPKLKHGDIIIYNTKTYIIKDVQDKAYSNHIVYLADLKI